MNKRTPAVISIIVVLGFFAGIPHRVDAKPAYDYFAHLPAVYTSPEKTAIVVDHRHTDISLIPDMWIEAARQKVVHYAHTSHGNQILVGLEWLESRDSRFNVDIHASGSVVVPDDTTAMRVYDGNNYPGNTYITPDMYWEGETGLNHTRSVAGTGWFNFSLWTWCGQMSYYEDYQIQQYIDAMASLESEYPTMRFIYYTGHTDGSIPGSPLWLHNDMVRTYVQANDKVLFDFADIESYDPENHFYSNATDACPWCDGYCKAHSTSFECQDIPTDCDHTHGLQCTLKGQAFWYLMARLSGWDGNP